MGYIIAPIIVGIITLGIYKLFELFVGKKERLIILEKLGDKFDPSIITNRFSLPTSFQTSFSTLKLGSLLTGMGLGLLLGYLISISTIPTYLTPNDNRYYIDDVSSLVYGACLLTCGGLGLIIAFIIELKVSKKK